MTGCPAWYDLALVNNTTLSDNGWNLKKICISDPANPKNYYLVKTLIEKMHELFSQAKITFVFHRAVQSDMEVELGKKLLEYEYVDVKRLSSSVESFSLYNRCDLHIGFRVHAHIYNLSQRKKSILIEEDGRGAGVNEVLGLPPLLAYNDENQIVYGQQNDLYGKIVRRLSKKFKNDKNDFIKEQVDSYIDTMIQTNGLYYQNAFFLMNEYYKTMDKYIASLAE